MRTSGPPMSSARPAGAPWASSARRAATSVTSTGWSFTRAGSGITGDFDMPWNSRYSRSWNWVARSTVQPVPESSICRSTASLVR